MVTYIVTERTTKLTALLTFYKQAWTVNKSVKQRRHFWSATWSVSDTWKERTAKFLHDW
jgi:vacuolar-type H+-ATPase catalytic subunit A/Vma1